MRRLSTVTTALLAALVLGLTACQQTTEVEPPVEDTSEFRAEDPVPPPPPPPVELDLGTIYFDFDKQATICSVTLLDIDEKLGTELRFYRNGDLTTPDETFSILTLGDGSVQRVEVMEPDVDRFEVYFKGSGAVGRVELVPCPLTVNFDETVTGVPLEFSAAGEVTIDTGTIVQGAPIGTNTTGQEAEGPHCVGASDH